MTPARDPVHGETAATFKLPQLDALRALAILSVFAQHTGDRFLPLVRSAVEANAPKPLIPWILTILHHAWWGVDLFFVLSGFSLALSWLRSGGASLLAFYRKRALRILPAYYVALLITLLFHRSVVHADDFGLSMLAHLLVLQGYWAPGGIVIIGATWSLTTEASFYLLFPWLVRTVAGQKRAALLGAALILAAWLFRGALHAAYLEPGVWTGALETTQRRLFPCRMDQFVLGMLAARAYLELKPSAKARAIAPFVFAASFPLLVVAFRLEGLFFVEKHGSYAYALLSVVTTLLVLSAALLEGKSLKLVAQRPLVFIGTVSYGVFLYHQLALGLCDLDRTSPPSWVGLVGTTTLALALSLLVGYASFTLIEKPCIALGSTPKRKL